MTSLRKRAWWLLAALTILLALFGIGDVLIGPAFDPGIALGLTGLTHAQLEAESAAGYRLLDFYTRASGAHLFVMGVALTAIVAIPYRAGQRWAWWTMWLFPAWTAAAFTLNLLFGVAEGQAPPPPMLSAPFLGGLAAVALLVDARRFHTGVGDGRAGHPGPARTG